MPRPRRYGSAERPLAPRAPARRSPSQPTLSGSALGRACRLTSALLEHPLSDATANERLQAYDSEVKRSFDRIVPVLKQLSALQHDDDFVEQAQRHALKELGHGLPPTILESAWVSQLDMRSLYAWCLFEAYEQVSAGFFRDDPLQGQEGSESAEAFNAFLLSCGFHLLDVSPCADGRLAHAIAYALRLPFGSVRRRPHAGAMFDVENTVDRWVRTEHLRYREARPNGAHEPTRYLKVVVYHFSSRDPGHEGCAAHGSNDAAAAAGGLRRLQEFQQAVENSFCCGASVDLLLIGLDTDTDAIRVHVPDVNGHTDLERWLDALDVYAATQDLLAEAARDRLLALVLSARSGNGDTIADGAVDPGMARLIARLIEHNISQIDFVRAYHAGAYSRCGPCRALHRCRHRLQGDSSAQSHLLRPHGHGRGRGR